MVFSHMRGHGKVRGIRVDTKAVAIDDLKVWTGLTIPDFGHRYSTGQKNILSLGSLVLSHTPENVYTANFTSLHGYVAFGGFWNQTYQQCK